MKRSNKILAVAITLVLLGALLLAPAHAAGFGGLTDILGELFNRWSQGDPNQGGTSFRLSDLFNNPEAIAQIREALSNYGMQTDDFSDSQIIEALSQILPTISTSRICLRPPRSISSSGSCRTGPPSPRPCPPPCPRPSPPPTRSPWSRCRPRSPTRSRPISRRGAARPPIPPRPTSSRPPSPPTSTWSPPRRSCRSSPPRP